MSGITFFRNEFEKITGISDVLPKGAPVLVVGLLPPESSPTRQAVRLALAGILAEPYRPGLALLMEPGPMAGNVSPKLIDRTCEWFWRDGFRSFDVIKKDADEKFCQRYVIAPDEAGLAARSAAESQSVSPMRLLNLHKEIVAEIERRASPQGGRHNPEWMCRRGVVIKWHS